MLKAIKQETWPKRIGRIVWNLSLISIGSIICAIAVNGIVRPMGFVSGGVTGISLIINYLFPYLSFGILYAALNVPLYVVGWKYAGRLFLIYSIVGTFIFAIALEWLPVPPIQVEEKLLAALLGGIVNGVGSGLILRSSGSSGGSDILAVMLSKRFSVRMGDTILFFNSAILIVAGFLFSLENALYTLILIYVASSVMDLVISGLSRRKAVMIISKYQEEIADAIMYELDRGVTVLDAHGGYSRQAQKMIYTVVSLFERSRLKLIVNKIDPDAFVVISDTSEVIGYRIGNQPHE